MFNEVRGIMLVVLIFCPATEMTVPGALLDILASEIAVEVMIFFV